VDTKEKPMQDTHTYSLQLHATPSVLLRIVAVCHRRSCAVTALDYFAGDQHRPGHLTLTIRGAAPQARRLEQWLDRLLDVEQVEHG
jgi:acetolactate synthase small subunit